MRNKIYHWTKKKEKYSYFVLFVSECSKHCSLCYNATECYDCVQGYFLTAEAECKSGYHVVWYTSILNDVYLYYVSNNQVQNKSYICKVTVPQINWIVL